MNHLSSSFKLTFFLCLILLFAAACRGDEANTSAGEQQIAAASNTETAVPTLQNTAVSAPTLTTIPTNPPPMLTAPPTAVREDAPTSTPALQPTETVALEPTETIPPPPTATPTITPTATIEAPPQPEWLSYLNRFRVMAGLSPVIDWEPYNNGSNHHSYYMVVNDEAIAHSEDPANPHFNAAGDLAARNGNIFATNQVEANYAWGMNFWASAPFHLVSMLDPNLSLVGYGDHVEAGGEVVMAAVLDIGSDPGQETGTEYPVIFPGPDTSTWVVRHGLFEWPDPLTSCPGFSRPTGAPLMLFLGDGSLTPAVANNRLAMGDTPLDTCVFDETSYSNPDAYAQKVGRTILSHNNAVVIIPSQPLPADQTYTAQLTANDQTHTWQFHTIKRPD